MSPAPIMGPLPRRAIADMNYARTVDGLHPIHSADTLTCRRTQRLTPTLR